MPAYPLFYTLYTLFQYNNKFISINYKKIIFKLVIYYSQVHIIHMQTEICKQFIQKNFLYKKTLLLLHADFH